MSRWAPVPLHETYTVDASGCWRWRLSRNHGGYGMVARNGHYGTAHRWVWVQLRGPIPSHLQIDHLCRVRDCVNPDHMELVTAGENSRRGNGANGVNFRKTHCKHGHPFDAVNTLRFIHHGVPSRACRTCSRERDGRYRQRRRAALKAVAA